MSNILVIVDVQNGYLRNERSLVIVDKIQSLIERDIFDKVVAVRLLQDENSVLSRCLQTKYDNQLRFSDIPFGFLDHINSILGRTTSNFVNSEFLSNVTSLNDGKYPDKIFIAGRHIDNTVLVGAVGLMDANIRPIVLSYYCGSSGYDDDFEAGKRCLCSAIGYNQIFEGVIRNKEQLDKI